MNSSQSEQANEKRRQQGGLDKAREVSIKALMATYEGRWFLADLMETSNLLQQRYLHDKDALGMAWRDGRASVAINVLELIEEHDASNYARLMRERRNRMKAARAEDEKRAKAAEPEPSPFSPHQLDYAP